MSNMSFKHLLCRSVLQNLVDILLCEESRFGPLWSNFDSLCAEQKSTATHCLKNQVLFSHHRLSNDLIKPTQKWFPPENFSLCKPSLFVVSSPCLTSRSSVGSAFIVNGLEGEHLCYSVSQNYRATWCLVEFFFRGRTSQAVKRAAHSTSFCQSCRLGLWRCPDVIQHSDAFE